MVGRLGVEPRQHKGNCFTDSLASRRNAPKGNRQRQSDSSLEVADGFSFGSCVAPDREECCRNEKGRRGFPGRPCREWDLFY